MRLLRWLPGLLMVIPALPGCSQPSAIRQNAGDVKTVASVGDRPLPVRSGVADSSVRSGVPEPVVTASTGRISGRVFDDQGKPVSDARVRLAVGSERGGKAVTATTDRSGAFTIRGLRPGSSYTLIADYQGRNGSMSGRVEAEAPEANVRIGLKRPAPARDEARTSIRPARPNVEPVSNVEGPDDSQDDEPAPRFNREDVDPPAPEAASLDRGESTASRQPAPARGAARQGHGWTQRPASGKTSGGSLEGGASRPSTPRETGLPEPEEGDEQNPLPPAIGSNEAGTQSDPDASSGEPARLARASGDPASADGPTPRLSGGTVDGARTISPESYGPIQMGDPEESMIQPANTRTRGTATGRSPRRSSSSTPDRPRPTWGELSFIRPSVPLDESLQRAGHARPAGSLPPQAQRAPSGAPGGPDASTSNRGRSLQTVTAPACRFDPAERRLDDFVLPDVQGRMTSFREFGADLILLDFWGTWCAPCKKSIDHLVEIQKKLGGKKLQVIGIACEKSVGPGRNDKVAQAMLRHGINYPVLISTMSGHCPVQEAFQIMFYPTLVLLDRDGRILWREEGATDDKLARVDRFIARNLNLGGARDDEKPPAQVARSGK